MGKLITVVVLSIVGAGMTITGLQYLRIALLEARGKRW